MMKKVFSSLLIFLIVFPLFSQTIFVEPYVQNTTDNSVCIYWETSSSNESLLFWGNNSSISNMVSGSTVNGASTAIIHKACICGLQADTRYYYKAVSGNYQSDTLHFRTLPSASSQTPFRIAVISDCQHDGNQTGKLHEVINDGIIQHCTQTYNQSDIDDCIALTLLGGDNVNTGSSEAQWRSEFFGSINNLGKHVGLVSCIGNHEANNPNYFAFFELPQNAQTGFEEHWFFKDISNIRIIALDANSGYQVNDQLQWLSQILHATGSNPQIDFVITIIHHPYRSELWLPGETTYSGYLLDSLEQFSNQYGKASLFLFGHTHGYSRGQLKNSKVLQMNVASASGYLDRWGTTPQADYVEFNKSFDEYGFNIIESYPGTQPYMVIKRYSRGDPQNIQNNILQDSILLRTGWVMHPSPQCIFPVQSGLVNPECVTLKASPFIPSNTDSVGAVEFQLSTDPQFNNIIFSKWKHTENWYFDANTLAQDTLEQETVINLQATSQYFWRVRYRSQNLDWTAWSNTESFFTGNSSTSQNLVLNPGAENGIADWVVDSGYLEALLSGECAGTSPYSGQKYFGIGGLCIESEKGKAHQDVDISSYAQEVDMGLASTIWGAYMSDYNGSDIPSIQLVYLDALGDTLSVSQEYAGNQTSWTLTQNVSPIPVSCRTIRYVLRGLRTNGVDNDSYIDDIFLQVLTNTIDCNAYMTATNTTERSNDLFDVYPSPATEFFTISIPEEMLYSNAKLIGNDGKTVWQEKLTNLKTRVNCKDFSPGIYHIQIDGIDKKQYSKSIAIN